VGSVLTWNNNESVGMTRWPVAMILLMGQRIAVMFRRECMRGFRARYQKAKSEEPPHAQFKRHATCIT